MQYILQFDCILPFQHVTSVKLHDSEHDAYFTLLTPEVSEKYLDFVCLTH